MQISKAKLVTVTACAVVLLYVLIVIGFEIGLRVLQPTWKGTLVLTTTDSEGRQFERVISGLRYDNALYIRANHWPREWYYQALGNPEVLIDLGKGAMPYFAVLVTGEEEKRVNARHGILFKWRFLTGFPPLKIMRLDPAKD